MSALEKHVGGVKGRMERRIVGGLHLNDWGG